MVEKGCSYAADSGVCEEKPALADIFTDTQVSEYSLSRLKIGLFCGCLLAGTVLWAQSASEKRAQKLVDKADVAMKARDFAQAKTLLFKAIQAEPAFAKSYLKLAGIFQLYRNLDSALLYYNRYTERAPAAEVPAAMWTRIAQMNFDKGAYELAQSQLNHVSDPPALLKESVAFAMRQMERSSSSLEITPLPPAINRFQLQYFPALTVDERTIIYTSRASTEKKSDEDLVVSTRIGGEWIPAQSISKVINTPYNEGAATISADGNTLIFAACEGRPSFGSCDLYITYRVGSQWSEPENLGSKVNSKAWESQPSLSADGRTLYFASNRPGGKGERDIWVTRYNGLVWSVPENLSINTPADDTTPFIHANGRTLFFSSKGYPGMGGFDLLVTTKGDTSWTVPVNLGYPVNTHKDEISLFVSPDGKRGYYASEREVEGQLQSHLVVFPIPADTLVKSKASYISGTVRDAVTGMPLRGQLKMTNLADTSDVYFAHSDSLTGKYFLVLAQGHEYAMLAHSAGYLFEDFTFTAPESTLLQPDTLDIGLYPIGGGMAVTLQNIYFESDDFRLQEQSRIELDEVAQFILANPGFRFLIEGHTDNVGDSQYNMKLSELRAKTVHDYLLGAGVRAEQISYSGFGEKQPVADNSAEEGRQRNRRIVFRVL